MISQPKRPQPRRVSESYDEKCERRHEARENLRHRNNTTTCRHLGRGAEEPPQSPRQREFLRRRNLVNDAGRTLPGQEPEARLALGISWTPPRPPVLLQQPRSCPTFPPAHSQLRLKVPLGIWAEAVPRRSLSLNTQGTQTLTQPSSGATDSSQQTDCGIAVFNKEMLQLSNYLKEALHRELLLKQKMLILQELFSTLLQASEKSWQGQLNEDKLKCKLRALENQLQACTQSYSKECVKKILVEMEDQKQTYEQKAKEALQKMLEDKLQTEQELQSSQRSLAVMRQDLTFWKEHFNTLKAELTKTTTAHTELQNSLHDLQSELQRAEGQREQLQEALHILQTEHTELHHQARALQEDNNLKAEHISTMEDKLQKAQSEKGMLEATISHLKTLIENQREELKIQEVTVQRKDQVFITQSPPLTPTKENQNTLVEHPEGQEEGEESLKDEMQKRTSQLRAKEKECWELRSELESLCRGYQGSLSTLRQCRDELQGLREERQHGHWIPLLLVVAAVAVATFLTSYMP
ncbi:TRAF3-interacting JNK-activating modulator [Calypte anna]|uniref:TRAF3-interacting JNK-activating modulator n=1 Tax=Calypte anna TaxID=9244 RepID=UPI0011C36176|nr:TRAF3-interacting JNK-activating modulator [Calypte anna]